MWKSHQTRIIGACLVLSAELLHSTSGFCLDLQSQIDPLAKALVEEGGAVGLVVGVYRDGEMQVIGYGEKEKGKGDVPDGGTIYEIGSASKVFTGVLLADLVQRGRVKLADPLQKYLRKEAASQLENSTGITFEDLATHTSGLPRLPDNFEPADMANPYADYSHQQMFEFLKAHKLRRDPGEYEYSNFGMGLLGVLLAGREKVSYEDLLIKQIAKPCGMRDTCVELSDSQRRRLAPPYDGALELAKNWDMPAFAGAGGIYSTTEDMLKFIEANLAKKEKALNKALQLALEQRKPISGGQAIGLAWHIAGDGITRWHNGMTGGYASWVSVVPTHNLGVVVLSNTATEEITVLGTKLTQIVFADAVGSPPDAPATPLAKKAPFAGVRWQVAQPEVPEVKMDDEWFRLVSLNEIPVAEIIAFSKRTYGDKWQKRFAEDLVELLTQMGNPPQAEVALQLQSLQTGETLDREGVAMTAANRQAIRAASQDQAVQVAPAILKSYEGVYRISPQFAITVMLDGDQLVVQATGQSKLQVYPESETRFFLKVVDAQITFVPGKEGKADFLILHQNGADQMAKREN